MCHCVSNLTRDSLSFTLRTWSIPFAQPDLALPVHQQEEMNLLEAHISKHEL